MLAVRGIEECSMRGYRNPMVNERRFWSSNPELNDRSGERAVIEGFRLLKAPKKSNSREQLAFFFGINQSDYFVLVDGGNKSRNA
jgi:hypothetical protein